MSIPALRQPKIIKQAINRKPVKSDEKNVIVTLKSDQILVISSDAYHGVIMGPEMYRCVFCQYSIKHNNKFKDLHINSQKHKRALESYPHLEKYDINLIRKLDNDNFYCSLCNVIVLSPFIARHVKAEAHTEELEKATARGITYKPM